jgi:hypothetical protein
MRHIIAVLIALLALSLFIPSTWALPSLLLSTANQTQPTTPEPETSLVTTPTIASFLSDTWTPSSYVPNVYTAAVANKQGYVANTTENIADFINGTQPTSVVTSMEGIYDDPSTGYLTQFLDPNWTPSTVTELQSTPDFKLHQMN